MTRCSRREFMRQSAGASLAAGTILSAGSETLGSAIPFAPRIGKGDQDYRALVAVYLDGGSDGASLLSPMDVTSRRHLESLRPGWVPPASSLRAIDQTGFGWSAAARDAADLFDRGRLSLVANVGPLCTPLDVATYFASEPSKTKQIPAQLFSHDAQRAAWRSGDPEQEGAWLSRVARAGSRSHRDPAVANAFAMSDPAPLFSGKYEEVSLDPSSYVEASSGVPVPSSASMRLNRADSDLLRRLSTSGGPAPYAEFPNTDLGRQLARIVPIIQGRKSLGQTHQVFQAVQSGWDRHRAHPEDLARLWRELTEALRAFDDALTRRGIDSGVTTFTASEFGRATRAGKKGLDHGWGNHHLVMGTSIEGGRVFGEIPSIDPRALNHVGGGRWLPTTSVAEYAATLAEGFGIRRAQLPQLFPSLEHFQTPTLGLYRRRISV